MEALINSDYYPDAAVIICVGRLVEIDPLIKSMRLAERDYAVLVSENNPDLNQRGNPSRSAARVLFTTQQMLESRVKRYGDFKSIEEFHYKGQPRDVRILGRGLSSCESYCN